MSGHGGGKDVVVQLLKLFVTLWTAADCSLYDCRLYGLQHTRLLCLPLSPGVFSN